ncbi:hypothetical protein E6R60_31745 [Streptomyces sp. A0642]|nr:hypothetical protein E6R60_31745 [Streptomyces sp. A0642]
MTASTSEDSLPDRAGAPEPAPARLPAGRRPPRHEIRALLRAHLAAASGYRHLTRHCAVCARLLRLAMEPLTASGAPEAAPATLEAPQPPGAAPAAAPAPGRPSERATARTAPPGPPPDADGHAATPGEAPEQTARPVMGPGPAAAPTAPEASPHALPGRPVTSARAARAVAAPASTTPGRAEEGPDGRIGPAWTEDERPPAA